MTINFLAICVLDNPSMIPNSIFFLSSKERCVVYFLFIYNSISSETLADLIITNGRYSYNYSSVRLKYIIIYSK